MAKKPKKVRTNYNKPLYPVLMRSSFERNDLEARDESVKPKRFISGSVTVYIDDTRNEVRLAECEFAAGESLANKDDDSAAAKKLFEIQAEYVIAVRIEGSEYPTDDELVTSFSDLAAASAWPLFRNLFATFASQANSELPHLPINPDFIVAAMEEPD